MPFISDMLYCGLAEAGNSVPKFKINLPYPRFIRRDTQTVIGTDDSVLAHAA